MKNLKNNILFLLYTAILGAIVGAIIWGFLRVMNLGITLIWDTIPSQLEFPYYTLCVCTVGGLLIGLYQRKFGDRPEELRTVMGQVKEKGRYPYNNIFSTLGGALFPLLIGASVGPEAGLSGVIAGLCTWVGDKLKRFRSEVAELTAIGLSATLGTIFRSPMFGFVEPLESDREPSLPKTSKTVLYIAAILSSFASFMVLTKVLGGSTGIDRIDGDRFRLRNYLFVPLLIVVGIAAGYLYFLFKKLTAALGARMKNHVVLRATVGGFLLGAVGTLLPLTMFSGEHQINEVMEDPEGVGAILLIVIGVVKLLLTNLCIDTGLKGGHFFPVIFSGVSIGCGMSLLLGADVVLCTAVVTATLVGHTMKKPLATVMLLMILFPLRLIPAMLLAAAAAKFIPTPKAILPKETAE